MYTRKPEDKTRVDHALTLTNYYLKTRAKPISEFVKLLIGFILITGIYLILEKVCGWDMKVFDNVVIYSIVFVAWAFAFISWCGILISKVSGILCLYITKIHLGIARSKESTSPKYLNDILFIFKLWTGTLTRKIVSLIIFAAILPIIISELDAGGLYHPHESIDKLTHQTNLLIAVITYLFLFVCTRFYDVLCGRKRFMLKDIPDPYISVVMTEYNYMLTCADEHYKDTDAFPIGMITCDAKGNSMCSSGPIYPLINFYIDIFDGRIITEGYRNVTSGRMYPIYALSTDTREYDKVHIEPKYYKFLEYLNYIGHSDLYNHSIIEDNVDMFCMNVAIANYLKESDGERCGIYYVGSLFDDNDEMTVRTWLLKRLKEINIRFCFENPPTEKDLENMDETISKLTKDTFSVFEKQVHENNQDIDCMILEDSRHIRTKEVYVMDVKLVR